MSLTDLAAALQPDQAVIAIVRARGDNSLYLVQVAGRGQDVVARGLGTVYGIGDPVIVLLEPNAQLPVILGPSPWMAHDPSAVVSPLALHWADIVDNDAACSASPDVAANTAARHNRLHSVLSASDHDAGGSAIDADVLAYDSAAGRWRPRSATTTPAGWADLYLLMGL